MNNIRQLAVNLGVKYRRRLFRQILCHERFKSTTDFENPPHMMSMPQFSVPKDIVGQPTSFTHPHMIRHGHLTCGITQAEYKERRDTLVNQLIAEVNNIHKNHIIVIPAARKQYMSEKIPYVFRQNSDFFYLTGCLEPSAILVLMKPAQTENYKSILFVHDKDSHAELWEGPRTGCRLAAPLFAVDEAHPVETFNNFIHNASAMFAEASVNNFYTLIRKHMELMISRLMGCTNAIFSTLAYKLDRALWYAWNRAHSAHEQATTSSSRPAVLWYHNECPANPDIHETVHSVLRQGQVTLEDPQRTLHIMRVVKSDSEVELMKETCFIGSQAMNMAMACTKPGISEHLISAVHEFSCRQGGAEHGAFPPVVAGGARATHIHYIANNQILDSEDMILVDAGSQRWLYNSDISRTWPVSGKFSKYHRILYELVLTVQKRLIELLGSQRPPLDQLFEQMCRLLGAHLQQEGVLPRNIDNNELIGKAYRLCPHHVSHYLGLDVHDAPLVRRRTPVRTGMVVTVEPGIYIRPDDESVPAEFRGVGIRIEDDVLVTDGEPLVLTDACVKEVADVEALVGKHTL